MPSAGDRSSAFIFFWRPSCRTVLDSAAVCHEAAHPAARLRPSASSNDLPLHGIYVKRPELRQRANSLEMRRTASKGASRGLNEELQLPSGP